MTSRQIMSKWLIRNSDNWLLPAYAEFHKQLLQRDLPHADEMELQVLCQAGKDAKAKDTCGGAVPYKRQCRTSYCMNTRQDEDRNIQKHF